MALFDEYERLSGLFGKQMSILTFIQFFDMSREEFDTVNAKRYEHLLEFDLPTDPQHLFNADIIFTFDNEIINDYYRREVCGECFVCIETARAPWCGHEFAGTFYFVPRIFAQYMGEERMAELREYETRAVHGYEARRIAGDELRETDLLGERILSHEQMSIVTFVQYFDMSRETFDRLNAERNEWLREHNIYEDPQNRFNADIIFTFDHEIINEYYRSPLCGECVSCVRREARRAARAVEAGDVIDDASPDAGDVGAGDMDDATAEDVGGDE
jgi:hypothetical protein